MYLISITCYTLLMEKKTTGELLREFRKERLGLSIREAAVLVGMHYTYLSRVESGISEPSDEMLERIALKYGMSAEEKANLFIAEKMSGIFRNVVRDVGEEKAAQIMYRRSKEHDEKKKEE